MVKRAGLHSLPLSTLRSVLDSELNSTGHDVRRLFLKLERGTGSYSEGIAESHFPPVQRLKIDKRARYFDVFLLPYRKHPVTLQSQMRGWKVGD